MLYSWLADAVVFVHFLWIVFLVFGAMWGRRRRVVRYLHIGGLAFAVTIQIFGWFCPLTHVEVWLRRKVDPGASLGGSFIRHYVERLVYIELSWAAIFGLTIVLVAANLFIYLRRGRS
jgi:hypothetical protein